MSKDRRKEPKTPPLGKQARKNKRRDRKVARAIKGNTP